MSITNVILVCIIVFLATICSRFLLHQEPREVKSQSLARLGLNVSSNDIMQYIKEKMGEFMPLMESKRISLRIKCDPESMMGWIDTVVLDNVIFLLLSDVTQRLHGGGKVSVAISTNPSYDHIYIRINDNGNPMSKMSFAILNDTITHHHGSIKSDDDSKQGNGIVIELPIKKEIYQAGQQNNIVPAGFHIPNNIELRVPTIELPEEYEEDYKSIRKIMHTAPRHADQEFLQRATKCINEHLSDTEYDRQSFASDMGSSESTLYNKIRAITGKSITNFIRDIRIEAACKMAKENPDLRVSDIAYQVGFKDPKYFATSFKRVMGTQPKEYFAEIREEAMALTEEGEKRRFSIWDELEPHKG